MKQYIKKYNCGICVEPNNVEQLKQAIYFLENNKEKAYEMGMNGMRAVREEYNWNNVIDNYINIFK